MGKIVVLDNPLDTTQRREYAHSGPLIDWLQVHYPGGFDRPHVAAFNTQHLAVADYDRVVGEQDVVAIGLVPAFPPGVIVAMGMFLINYVVPALVSFALSYIVNSIFGRAGSSGSKNAGKSLPDPSPTYSLSVPTNVARLGQPIPVIYGRVITTPDLASTPYSWFEGNEMYAGMLFCLGQGWHELHELRVAATPVQQLAGGTVTFRVFSPEDHAQSFGVIQGAMGFYENVYTSPEVADQELDADRTGGGNPDCYWIYQHSIDCASSRFIIDAEPAGSLIDCAGQMPPVVALPSCVAVGQTVTLSNAGVNDGTYTIAAFEEYEGGGWVQLSPPLQCAEAGVSFVSQSGQIHEPIILPGQDRYVDVYLVECETGWFVDGTCSQHPLPNYVEDGEDAITITWQEQKLLGVTVTYTLTGTLTRVRREWDISSQVLYLRVSNHSLDADQLGWPPSLCQPSTPGDDTYSYDCTNLTDLAVNVTALSERPQIAWQCEAGSSDGAPPTCGELGIGPFVAMPPGWTSDRLQLDIVFPYGLYQAGEDGNLASASCTLLFTAHPVDDDGLVIGTSIEKTVTYTAASNTPQRHTVNWVLPKARYSVCARRTTPKSERAVDMSNAIWTGLKAILDSKDLPVYDQTTIIAVKAKATNGLASDALNRFSVDCTRRLPDYLDRDSDSNSVELAATNDHVLALADIFTNAWYGAARPASEVDWDSLRTCWQRTESAHGFNAVFDSQVSVWEAMSLAVAAVHAFPVTSGNQVAVVEDIARATASHAFNASNIVQDSLQISYKFNDLGTPDGVEIEYRDPDTFQQAFILYPELAQYPEKLTLFGCTSQAEAEAYARRVWRQRCYRREFVSFQTELEGHLPLIGELISIDHPLLAAPVCYIVGSITPGDEQKVTLEGHRYVPAVYRDE